MNAGGKPNQKGGFDSQVIEAMPVDDGPQIHAPMGVGMPVMGAQPMILMPLKA